MTASDMGSEHPEKVFSTELEDGPASRVVSNYADNYHGLNLKTVLVYFSINLIVFAQLLNLVGSGAYARDIASVVGGSVQTVWLSSAIAIFTCFLGPPISQAADFWGRKWFIVVLTLFGAVGCIVVSRATSMGMAIAGEVVAGVAYGAQPLLYAVPSEILPRRYRPIAQAGINVFAGLGGIVGLLAGSAFVNNTPADFRKFWYLTAAILGVSALIFAFLYNPPLREFQISLSFTEKMQRLDWIGYSLLVSGLVLFTMALTWSQNPYPWTNAHILAPFLIGVAILLALVIYQTKFRSDGIFHHGLFSRDRNFAIALVLIFVEGMVFFAANDFLPFETSVLYVSEPLKIGVRLCVTFITAIFFSTITAIYSSATKKLRLPTVIAFWSFAVFNVLMATANLGSSTALWGYPVFLGIGLGVCLTNIVTAAQLSAPQHLIAIASGLVISTRSLGGSVSVAIINAIFNSGVNKNLGKDIAAAVLPLGLTPAALPRFIAALAANDQKALLSIPGVTPQIIAAGAVGLQSAYLSSFRWIWITMAIFSLLAATAALFFVNPQKDLNMHVDAPLEPES